MASRLDRLFILLETGSSQATRRTAAQQLGSVARSYPDQLPQLLTRVGKLLRASSWETRIAAGAATRALLEHTPKETEGKGSENYPADSGHDQFDNERKAPSPHSPEPSLASILPQLLDPAAGTLLMAAEGACFDRVTDVDEKKQRELLKKQIYGEVGALIGADDVFEDDMGLAESHSQNGGALASATVTACKENEPALQQLSSRQLNTAKRRAKQRAAPPAGPTASAPEKRPKLIDRQVANVREFTAALLEDLCAVDWETRHGGATGLREVIIARGPVDGEASGSILLTHLVRILALDRFSDFVSDQLVAPVRETAGQALGALLPHLEDPQVAELCRALVQLLEAKAWETRHGALIGLKYLLTLRGAPSILHASFDAVQQALASDHNDDVSAAAAAALLPVVPALVQHIDEPRLRELITVLHRALQTLDDLSSASCNVMELLAALLEERRRRRTTPGAPLIKSENSSPSDATESAQIQNGDNDPSQLLELLLPFLHHKSSSVRRCALQSLLSASASPLQLPLALRHLYERALLETEDLHALIHQVWRHLLRSDSSRTTAAATDLENIVKELLPFWLWLAMVNPRLPLPHGPTCLLSPPCAEKTFISSGSPDPAKVAATRLALARMLADLPEGLVLPSLEPYLLTASGLQRTVSALVIWFRGESERIPLKTEEVPPYIPRLQAVLEQNLNAAVAYEEVAAIFTRLQTEAKDFLITLRHYGVQVALDASGQVPAPSQWLSLDQVGLLVGEDAKTRIAALRTKKTVELLEERRKGVESAREEAVKEWRDVNRGTLACISSALIALPLPLPAKLSPVIKPLMDAVRSEPNVTLQRHTAYALVRLLGKATAKANNKVIQNLIASLNAGQSNEGTVEGAVSGAGSASATAMAEKEKSVEVRGAEMALEAVCRGADVEACGLWEHTVGQLLRSTPGGDDDGGREKTAEAPPPTLLPTINFILPHLPATLHQKLPTLLPRLLKMLPHAARTVAVLCQLLPNECMAHVVEALLEKMRTLPEAEGAVITVHEVVEALGLGMLPWVALLVVPVLGLMSSPSQSLRPVASLAFAALIRLLPLESGVPPPPSLPPHLVALREEQRDFLEQLLNPSRIAPYEVKAEIRATLRPYQEGGVNWLGFLRRFGLHGILCDDMGLGKTLMCICLLAEEVRRAEEREKAGGAQEMIAPSLVVCPPTLTGHWVYEIQKFAPNLRPLHYHGPPAERSRLQDRLGEHNILIASYDIVRNDLEFFESHLFYYCVLDEGHVIKNGRTKLSKAIKQLRAAHRLILTGTPIQNHVLELHSLFDFLMPGFLGSERGFAARFARPILAARDAKCSDKEAEAGALAMEALHRQALPFLLRRLKEDVLRDLPPKITQDYFCALSPLQALLYEDFAKTRAGRSLATVGASAAAGGHARATTDVFTHIFQSLQYLRKVCNHPKLVLQGHPKAAEIVAGMKPGEIDQVTQSGKLGALKQLLNSLGIFSEGSSSPGPSPHRALIFCQLKSMLDILESDLLRAHMPSVTWLRLDGSVPAGQRQALVQRFNQDVGIDLLLLTTQVGGLGLNLTGADTVIFVEHDWNPMRDLQAMDRAHRIGQTRTVNVYRLITRGTLEEKIMGLQKFKLLTAQTVIGGENKQLETMRTDQLLDLFTLDTGANGGGGAAAATACRDREQRGKDEQGAGLATDGLLGAYRHVIEAVPELWDEKLYDDEYDLSAFIKSLG